MDFVKSILRFQCIRVISPKNECLIIGIINFLVAGIVLIGDCCYVANMRYTPQFPVNPWLTPDVQSLAIDVINKYMVALFVYVCSATSFVFSILLCYGVQRKKLGFVNVYIYHLFISWILVTLTLLSYLLGTRNLYTSEIFIGSLGCGIYVVLIIEVQSLYKKMLTETEDTESLAPLEEQPPPPYEACTLNV